LTALVQQSRRVESELVAHIGEVDRRRLYLREATSSMFVYCTEVLHLSEHEAYMRIAVARASRKYPVVLTMLRDGRLHLSAIAKLAPHLDGLDLAGREQLLERATHKSKRNVEALVAALAPKPDVPATIRKLPELKKNAAPETGRDRGTAGIDGTSGADAGSEIGLGPDRVDPATVQPLAPARYKVIFTGSSELREKLDRLQSLMPDCDLAEIIEQAVSEIPPKRPRRDRYVIRVSPHPCCRSTHRCRARPWPVYVPQCRRWAVPFARPSGVPSRRTPRARWRPQS